MNFLAIKVFIQENWWEELLPPIEFKKLLGKKMEILKMMNLIY